MNRLKAALTALIISALLTTLFTAAAEGSYVGSRPDSGVYVTQTQKRTCTLISATMMIRNYSDRIGNGYDHITEKTVRQKAWSSKGLSHSFSVDGISVTVSKDIKNADDKKAYLISCLKKHPEGIVIYDSGAPHAIFLFGYDAATDTFYCADTISKNGGKAITLEESIIKGGTQQAQIDTIDRIWHIAAGGAG